MTSAPPYPWRASRRLRRCRDRFRKNRFKNGATPSDTRGVQRREFARVSHLATVRVRIRGRWENGLMIDLGEGGMSCALPDDPRVGPGEPVIVNLPLDDGELELGAVLNR